MSNNKYKILIIEDEANIRSLLETILTTNDYQVLSAQTAKEGNIMFHSYVPDLVILDLGLPDMDGTDIIKDIRSESVIPVIVLSARMTEQDKISALDFGANDYITKPFCTGELMARIRAVLRSSRHSAQSGALPGGRFVSGGLTIDYDYRLVKVDGREVSLTQTEYNIVALLSEHSGKVMTYSAIICAVWGSMDQGSTKKLQVNMANIRKKFGCKPGGSSYIKNELGVGYRMVEEDSE